MPTSNALTSFPCDIWQAVFRFIDVQELMHTVSTVCRFFYEMCCARPGEFWKHMWLDRTTAFWCSAAARSSLLNHYCGALLPCSHRHTIRVCASPPPLRMYACFCGDDDEEDKIVFLIHRIDIEQRGRKPLIHNSYSISDDNSGDVMLGRCLYDSGDRITNTSRVDVAHSEMSEETACSSFDVYRRALFLLSKQAMDTQKCLGRAETPRRTVTRYWPLCESGDIYHLSIFSAETGARRNGTKDETATQLKAYIDNVRKSWHSAYTRHFSSLHNSECDGSHNNSYNSNNHSFLKPPLFTLNTLARGEKIQNVYEAHLAGMSPLPDGMGTFFPLTATAEAVSAWVVRRQQQQAASLLTPSGREDAVQYEDLPAMPPVGGRRYISFSHEEESGEDDDTQTCSVSEKQGLSDVAAAQLLLAQEEDAFLAKGFCYARVAASSAAAVSLECSTVSSWEVDSSSTSASSSALPGVSTGLSAAPTTEEDDNSKVAASSSSFVPLLFSLPHVMSYLFMLQHTTCTQVDHHKWEPDENKYAVYSRVISPTGDSVETRFFFSSLQASYPRVFAKMSFMKGVPPRTLMREKFAPVGAPYARQADDERNNNNNSSSNSFADRHPDVPGYVLIDLFCAGYGRVEIDVAPAVSRRGMILLRRSLGLAPDFPPSLLWNIVMHASGSGASLLAQHMPWFLQHYRFSFTDAVEEVFGMRACYGVLRPVRKVVVEDGKAAADGLPGVGAEHGNGNGDDEESESSLETSSSSFSSLSSMATTTESSASTYTGSYDDLSSN